MKKTQLKQIEELKNELSSAYQEQAVDSVLESVKEYDNPIWFANDVCDAYREILKGAGYDDQTGRTAIYRAFALYGDETELNDTALKVYAIAKPKNTPKEHFNKIVANAWKINKQLEALRKKAESLIEECEKHREGFDYDDWEYYLNNLAQTLSDLANFDLEDSIPDTHSVEY